VKLVGDFDPRGTTGRHVCATPGKIYKASTDVINESAQGSRYFTGRDQQRLLR
jgi:hypothetical protein